MEEKTIRMKQIYEGRVVALEVHDVELSDGCRTVREVVRHGPAVAIVAEMTDGRFAFVRQFRKPVEKRMLEVVAGCCDPDEATDAAALRELREETGYEAAHLERLGAIYPSPGYVDERIEIYYARLAADPVGTDEDEDERVELVVLDRTQVEQFIRSDEVHDAKTLAAWALYERMSSGRTYV